MNIITKKSLFLLILLSMGVLVVISVSIFLLDGSINAQRANAQVIGDCEKAYGVRCTVVPESSCGTVACRPGLLPEDQPYCGLPACSTPKSVTKCSACELTRSTGEGPNAGVAQCEASFAWNQCEAGSSYPGACQLNSRDYKGFSSVNCGTLGGGSTGPYCGDGSVNQSSETCDDGNTTDGDGCSSTCQVEQTQCTGQNGDCSQGQVCCGNLVCGSVPFGTGQGCILPTSQCGNGVLNPGEQCDLGSGNGPLPSTCSNSCTINSQPPPTSGPQSCGRCSNNTPGTFVTWTDLDGGCDSDFYNNRSESPNDPRCTGGPPPPPPDYQCSDNRDNDGDNLIDRSDPGCLNSEGRYNPYDDDERNKTTETEKTPPIIASFNANPNVVSKGGQTTLTWRVQNLDDGTCTGSGVSTDPSWINDWAGPKAESGSQISSPGGTAGGESTTYTLTCENDGGTDRRDATVIFFTIDEVNPAATIYNAFISFIDFLGVRG